MEYNLRSKRRNCFLKKSILDYKHILPGNSEPKVFLEVLNVLNSSDCDRFYLKNGKIIPYVSKCKKSNSFSHLWVILFTVLALAVFSFSWKGNYQMYSKELFKASVHVFSQNSMYTNQILRMYEKAFGKEKKILPKNKVNLLQDIQLSLQIPNEKGLEVSESSVKEFVTEYITKKKNKEISTWNKTEPPIRFIEEQCKIEPSPKLADNIFPDKDDHFYENKLSNVTDYALQSLGAKVVSIFDTEPYGVVTMKLWKYNFGILPNYLTQIYLHSKSPKSVLETWKKPGDCWAFKGSRGRVRIQFRNPIIITAIAMEHIPKNFSNSINLTSAPKKFSVIGLEDINSLLGKIHMGIFEYRASGPHQQIFFLTPKLESYLNGVEVSFESNHGNKEYTCVYKIKIYGYE